MYIIIPTTGMAYVRETRPGEKVTRSCFSSKLITENETTNNKHVKGRYKAQLSLN